jgi:hypothetical protein
MSLLRFSYCRQEIEALFILKIHCFIFSLVLQIVFYRRSTYKLIVTLLYAYDNSKINYVNKNCNNEICK